jgi:hypothetical protein
VLWLQKVHAVGKGEAKPGGTMAFLMPVLHGLNRRRQPRQRISYFTRRGALWWQSGLSSKRQKDSAMKTRG